MTDACFLAPPADAGLAALKRHLAGLREMDQRDELVRMAIEDTERLIAEAGEIGTDAPEAH